MFVNSRGAERKYHAEAVKWLRKAAEQGHEEAQRGLETLQNSFPPAEK